MTAHAFTKSVDRGAPLSGETEHRATEKFREKWTTTKRRRSVTAKGGRVRRLPNNGILGKMNSESLRKGLARLREAFDRDPRALRD